MAAWIGAASPLILGLVLAAGLGWRGAVGLCLVLAGGALLVGLRSGGGRRPDGASAPVTRTAPRSSLRTRRFVLTCVALFTAVGSEFAVDFWGATVLRELTSDAGAAAGVSAVVVGLAVGRTGGAWVLTRMEAHPLMLAGFTLTGVGFAVFWSSGSFAVAVAGLFVVGLGLATLFPTILDRIVANSGGQPDRVLAIGSLVLGSAIGIAPFALGTLASVVPVREAFLLVAGLLAVLTSRPVREAPVATQ